MADEWAKTRDIAIVAIVCLIVFLLAFFIGLVVADPVWRCDHYLTTWKSNAEGTIERVDNITVCGFDRSYDHNGADS